MGLCTSAQPGKAHIMDDELDRRKKTKEVDEDLLHQSKLDEEKIKLLLLGAGESGKSTVFKQMKVIYGDQYTDQERRLLKPTIYSNIIIAMKILMDQVVNMNFMEELKETEAYEFMRRVDQHDVITTRVGDAIKTLWNDPAIQKVWSRRNKFQIIDSVNYYFNKIDTIKAADYIPNKDDIVHARVRTSGIVTMKFTIDKTPFELYDVGGQRNERRKWIHCFEGVTAVIFVAAISEYDQVLFEDNVTNRMVRFEFSLCF
jgi:GTPase SAR1 family protein